MGIHDGRHGKFREHLYQNPESPLAVLIQNDLASMAINPAIGICEYQRVKFEFKRDLFD